MLTGIDRISAQQWDSEIGHNPESQSVVLLGLFLILCELAFICFVKGEEIQININKKYAVSISEAQNPYAWV